MARLTPTPQRPSDIFGKIRRIEIRTSKLVNELFGGRYLSSFKGRGMEFVDVREYVPGDDIRSIHWNVTARLNHPYVKRFTEERELTILVAVDVSQSQFFGTRRRLKSELAAELISILAFSALKNNDKIGVLLFSDKVEEYIAPRKSKKHCLRLIRDVLEFEPSNRRTNMANALQYLNSVQKKRAVVFLISDFLDAGFEHALKVTRRHHDTIAFVLEDPMEGEWPAVGRIMLEDAENDARLLSPRGGPSFRELYAAQSKRQTQGLKTLFSRMNLDHVIFRTNEDYVKPLVTFFQERAKRFRR